MESEPNLGFIDNTADVLDGLPSPAILGSSTALPGPGHTYEEIHDDRVAQDGLELFRDTLKLQRPWEPWTELPQSYLLKKWFAASCESYYKDFHQHWPVVHVPTFDYESEPSALLATVAMIGNWYRAPNEMKDSIRGMQSFLLVILSEELVCCFALSDVEALLTAASLGPMLDQEGTKVGTCNYTKQRSLISPLHCPVTCVPC